MTPKEKAVEILHTFASVTNDSLPNNLHKQCALIAVDEIIKAIDWHEFETPNKELEYWNKVKQEIENL